MDYWPLKPEARETPIGLSQATALLARVGHLQPGALAGALLDVLGKHVALAQCVVFSYSPQQPPRVVSYADRSRTRELPDISREYAERFFLEDTNRLAMHELMAGRRLQPKSFDGAGSMDDPILVHRQLPEDIANADYRAICYDQPRISDRIALLSLQDAPAWLSINLYRGREHGRFDDEEIHCIESFAPFLTQLARLHLRCHQYDNELGLTLLQRMRWRFPSLTRRDMDLLSGVVDGQDVDQIAQAMGIQAGSVETYTKRIYRKLGISGRRELFALMLSPVSTPAN
jgi:DNA-binding CsgD family transcriptional regulator